MKIFAITTFTALLITAIYLTISLQKMDHASFEQESDSYEAKNMKLISSSNDELNRSNEGENSTFENIDDLSEGKLHLKSKNNENTNHNFQLEDKNSDMKHNSQLQIQEENEDDTLAIKHGIPEEFIRKNSEEHSSNFGGHTNHSDEQVNYFKEEIVTTSASIKQNYEEKFEALETSAIEEVTNLVELAMNDYRSQKDNGENISYFYFFRTYYPKVTALQNDIDTRFEKKYTSLQDELKKHGYSPEKAERFKEEFEGKKDDLMEMVKGLVGQVL